MVVEPSPARVRRSRSRELTCRDIVEALMAGLKRPPPLSLRLRHARSLPFITSATGGGCIIHMTSSREETFVTVAGCRSLIGGLRFGW